MNDDIEEAIGIIEYQALMEERGGSPLRAVSLRNAAALIRNAGQEREKALQEVLGLPKCNIHVGQPDDDGFQRIELGPSNGGQEWIEVKDIRALLPAQDQIAKVGETPRTNEKFIQLEQDYCGIGPGTWEAAKWFCQSLERELNAALQSRGEGKE